MIGKPLVNGEQRSIARRSTEAQDALAFAYQARSILIPRSSAPGDDLTDSDIVWISFVRLWAVREEARLSHQRSLSRAGCNQARMVQGRSTQQRHHVLVDILRLVPVRHSHLRPRDWRPVLVLLLLRHVGLRIDQVVDADDIKVWKPLCVGHVLE